ncbi:hypothetical protein LIER_14909 [Lithospermum erythrorhizon]|uniref:Uncharacterized protein n=1 Tax=Lithospermum erythrorhizon TaxID=34254 RepID=A0AAV3Q3D7_LITER
MTSLDDRLVNLKTQEDMDEMIRWTKGVREIEMFVTHPTRKVAKSLVLGETYADLRSKWSKATLKEIDDDEARLLGFNEGCDIVEEVNNDEFSNSNIRLLPRYPAEVQGVEEERVEGGSGDGG